MTRHCAVVPIGLLTDLDLHRFYDRLKTSGIIKAAFPLGGVDSKEAFAATARQPGTVFFGLLWDGEPSGFVTLDQIRGRWAHIHFAFFKNVWGKKAITLGRHALASLLYWKTSDDTFMFDGFLGITPENNKLAQRFVKKVGVTSYCMIPGIGLITHVSRKEIPASYADA
jgi:hypothetical protein